MKQKLIFDTKTVRKVKVKMDPKDKILLEQLLLEEPSAATGGSRQQLSGADQLLLTGSVGTSEEAEPSGPELRVYDPVDFYLLLDASNSEDPIFRTVLASIQDFAMELYGSADTGHVRFLLSLVRDHSDKRDWYQQFDATDNMDTFAKQLRSVKCFGGGDEPEALECAWYEVTKRVLHERQHHPGRKAVAVTVSSSIPHGLLRKIAKPGSVKGWATGDGSQGAKSKGYSSGIPLPDFLQKVLSGNRFGYQLPGDRYFELTDNGCEHKREYEATWKALTAAVEGNYFVGTSRLSYSPFREIPMHDWQRECVMTGDPKQHYLAIGKLSELSPTFMAAVRATQSITALNRLLEGRYQGQPQLERQVRLLTAPGDK